MHTPVAVVGLVLLWSLSGLAQDGDVHDLQENLPVRVTDALASSGPQIQARLLTTRERTAGTEAEFEPQIQWGFASRWHVQLSGVMIASSREQNTNSGDLELLLFHQINKPRGNLPILAASAAVDTPTGIDSAGLDTRLRGIITQNIGSSGAQHRVHANVEWLHNAGRRDDERANAWLGTAGYSRLLGRNSVLIIDAARLQQRAVNETINLLEAGVRGRVRQKIVISGGFGVGLGPHSPSVQFTIGIEQSF
jgi:hypothetical protein